jgi:hypothetical protein
VARCGCTRCSSTASWDLLDAAGWQVRQGGHDLTVPVAAPGPGVDPAAVDRSIRVALAAVGARVRVAVRVIDTVPAGAAGKRPLVVAHHAAQCTDETGPSAWPRARPDRAVSAAQPYPCRRAVALITPRPSGTLGGYQ